MMTMMVPTCAAWGGRQEFSAGKQRRVAPGMFQARSEISYFYDVTSVPSDIGKTRKNKNITTKKNNSQELVTYASFRHLDCGCGERHFGRRRGKRGLKAVDNNNKNQLI